MTARVARPLAALFAASLAVPGIAFAANLTIASQTLTVYRSCALTAYPGTSTTEIDATVDQLLATTNNGTGSSITVQSLNLGNQRAYLTFDLTKCNPAIPSSASVKQATLRLYVTVLAATCRTLDIFDATASWTETGITWNNQPFGTSTNNPPSNQRTDAIQVGSGTCTNSTANAYVNGWNVTGDVAAFVAGTSTNNGWMIRDDSESSVLVRTNTFSSGEAGAASQAPQLIVTYTT